MAKYIHEFETKAAYNTERVNNYIEPWTSLTDSTGIVNYNKSIPNMNGHEYVDLGLPSGNLWATMNIGANSFQDSGYYFSYAETSPKESYAENTYNFIENNNYTKYNSTDGLTELELEDDAAHIIWRGDWIIPSKDDWYELWNNTTASGSGSNPNRIITLRSNINNNEIKFGLPCGYMNNSTTSESSLHAYLLTSTSQISSQVHYCWPVNLYYYSANDIRNESAWTYRYRGYTVRPIIRL